MKLFKDLEKAWRDVDEKISYRNHCINRFSSNEERIKAENDVKNAIAKHKRLRTRAIKAGVLESDSGYYADLVI